MTITPKSSAPTPETPSGRSPPGDKQKLSSPTSLPPLTQSAKPASPTEVKILGQTINLVPTSDRQFRDSLKQLEQLALQHPNDPEVKESLRAAFGTMTQSSMAMRGETLKLFLTVTNLLWTQQELEAQSRTSQAQKATELAAGPAAQAVGLPREVAQIAAAPISAADPLLAAHDAAVVAKQTEAKPAPPAEVKILGQTINLAPESHVQLKASLAKIHQLAQQHPEVKESLRAAFNTMSSRENVQIMAMPRDTINLQFTVANLLWTQQELEAESRGAIEAQKASAPQPTTAPRTPAPPTDPKAIVKTFLDIIKNKARDFAPLFVEVTTNTGAKVLGVYSLADMEQLILNDPKSNVPRSVEVSTLRSLEILPRVYDPDVREKLKASGMSFDENYCMRIPKEFDCKQTYTGNICNLTITNLKNGKTVAEIWMKQASYESKIRVSFPEA